jgi:hypothetical protein
MGDAAGSEEYGDALPGAQTELAPSSDVTAASTAWALDDGPEWRPPFWTPGRITTAAAVVAVALVAAASLVGFVYLRDRQDVGSAAVIATPTSTVVAMPPPPPPVTIATVVVQQPPKTITKQAPPPAVAEPYDPNIEDHVAVAIAPSNGRGGYGIAGSPEQATAIALAQCRMASGAPCVIAAGIRHGCAVYAIGSGRWQGGRGPTSDAAIADALESLPDGVPLQPKCSTT